MYNRGIRLGMALAILTLVGSVWGCGSSGDEETTPEGTKPLPPNVTIIQSTPESSPVVSSPTASPAETSAFDLDRAKEMLERFLGASDLHVKGQYSSVTVDGSKDGPTPFELWQKGQMVRIDYYKNNALYRTLIVRDGAATFYFYGSGNKTASIMPAVYYTDLLCQRPQMLNSSEMSDDGKTAVFTFTVDRFYKNEKAQAGYYVTEVRYTVGPDGILSQTVYGKDSYGSKPAAVNRVTDEFSLVEINSGVNDTIFGPPF